MKRIIFKYSDLSDEIRKKIEKKEMEKKELFIVEMGACSSPQAIEQLLKLIKGEPIVAEIPESNFEVEYLKL